MAIAGCRECLGFVDRTDLLLVNHATARHAERHGVGDSCDLIIAIINAEDRVIVLAGEDRLEVFFSNKAEFAFKNGARGFEARVGGW